MDQESRSRFILYIQNQKDSLNWAGLAWHHSATKDGSKNDIEAIRRYHKSFRVDGKIFTEEEYNVRVEEKKGSLFQTPWKDVGYHFLLEKHNGKVIWEPGRDLSTVGAHAYHPKSSLFNHSYVGLCCVGNYDIEPIDKELWKTSLEMTRCLLQYLELKKDTVIGHREVYDILNVPRQKECPGKNWDMKAFRDEI